MKNKKSNTALHGFGNLIPYLSQQQGWEEQLDLHSVFVHWHELLDSDITKHCQPLKIVKKVLWIEVENSAWLQQLQYQTVFLLDILNSSLRISKLKGLRFCVVKEEMQTKEQPERALSYVQPPVEDIAKFEKQIEEISDKDSKEALLRFWYISKSCKKG